MEQTLLLVPVLRKRFGITRIAETTFLDRTGIPTFSAFVPKSADFLGVYNGKGLNRDAAIASAVMEAVERQIGAAPQNATRGLSLDEMPFLADLVNAGILEVDRETVIESIEGFDVLRSERVAVPLSMVQCPWAGMRLFPVVSTNGLASGNTLIEAIYHALCELIERHAWSLYHAKSYLLPRLLRGPDAPDRASAPEIRFPTGNAVIDRLRGQIDGARLALRAFYLENAPLPATMMVVLSDLRCDLPMSHVGFGCSLSPAHALVRAMTEAAQSRAVDIQAAREDIYRVEDDAGPAGAHGQRQASLPHGRWYFDVPARGVSLESIDDESTSDLSDDLDMVLSALRKIGSTRAIVVDLSPEDLPVHVVRAIVPDLETTAVDGRIGEHVRAALNPFCIR